MALRAIMAV